MAPAKSSAAATSASNPMEKRCRMRDLNENITCKVSKIKFSFHKCTYYNLSHNTMVMSFDDNHDHAQPPYLVLSWG